MSANEKMGYVHSIYNGGMVDGPGIRSVVFLSGCGLRCKYCHNPDTWDKKSGTEMTVEECMTEILKYKSYYKFSGGGVTISGGEPLHQHKFVSELLKACRSVGVHTVLDTSGFANPAVVEAVLPLVDMVLLDIKSYNKEIYKELTGVDLAPTIEFAKMSQRFKVPVWIRYVLVPGITDDVKDLEKLANFLSRFDNIEKITVLPFHKQGEHKWEQIGLNYELYDTPVPTITQVEEAQRILDTGIQKGINL